MDSGAVSSRVTPGAWPGSPAVVPRRMLTSVKGHQELPGGGREFCPLVATRSAQSSPPDVPRVFVQRYHSLPREGLGQADAVAAVRQTCAWCMSRSTVAVARVLGISSSNADG